MDWLPEPKSNCWAWFQPLPQGKSQLSSSGPRDAAALPHSARAHAERNKKGLWGHRAFRLAPVSFLGMQGDLALVEELRNKGRVKLKPGLIIDWYEGLLVIDAVQRSGQRCSWLSDEVVNICQKEKSKRLLSSSLYVSKKLLTASVTGPQFVSREGKLFSHRRRLRNDTHVAEADELPMGFYKVDRLLEYLPPWEAFVHPKCGLYQDWYLVLWAPPHLMDSYSRTPQGCDQHPHATWEPDECLPDDLDVLRKSAKKRWLELQKEKEKGVTRAVPEGHKDRKRLLDEQQGPAKSYCLDLGRHIRHGLREDLLDEVQQAQIKKGWPKSLSEYPEGHAPAAPPGGCWDCCDCMEDWHVGSVDSQVWLENSLRMKTIQTTMENFKSFTSMLRIRGQVSKQWYFEPVNTGGVDASQLPRRQALQVANVVQKSILAAVTPLPLAALTEPGASDLLRSLTVLREELLEGPFEPMAFEKVSGPEWILVDCHSGEISTEPRNTPRAFKAETLSLEIHFVAWDRDSLTLQIGPMKPALPENLAAWTGQINDKLRGSGALNAAVAFYLQQVYDTEGRCLRRGVTLAQWLRVMKQVYIIARAAANAASIRPKV